jgi:hypothetical protein
MYIWGQHGGYLKPVIDPPPPPPVKPVRGRGEGGAVPYRHGLPAAVVRCSRRALLFCIDWEGFSPQTKYTSNAHI